MLRSLASRFARVFTDRRATTVQVGLWSQLLVFVASTGAKDAHGSGQRFRVAFSTSIMAKVNENDARAAVKVWADNLIKERGIQGTAVTTILSPTEVAQALNADRLDGAVLATPEFLTVDPHKISHILIAAHADGTHEEYLLLVHQASGLTNLASLRNRRLLFLQDYRTSLALPWLDVLLHRERLPSADQHFGGITGKDKPALVALPVFFRSADACLINRRSFEVLKELNPQVGKQLRVLATSPKLLDGVCCIAAGYTSPVKAQIIDALLHIKDSVAGEQIATVFQFGRLVESSDASLQSARELLAEYKQLRGKTNSHLRLPASTLPP